MNVPFKAAWLFDLHYLNKTNPESVALTSLSAFPFVTENMLSALKEE